MASPTPTAAAEVSAAWIGRARGHFGDAEFVERTHALQAHPLPSIGPGTWKPLQRGMQTATLSAGSQKVQFDAK